MENFHQSWSKLTKEQSDDGSQPPDLPSLESSAPVSSKPTIETSPDGTPEVPEIKSVDLAKIHKNEECLEVSGDQIIHRQKLKKYLVLAGLGLILVVISILFLNRPKETLLYAKHEEFGPCLDDKKRCYQDISIYLSGKVVFDGKITKIIKLSSSDIRSIKQSIINSKLISQNCKEAEILMEYKLTHTLVLNGKSVTIKSPGCDNETDSLDSNIKRYLQ